MNARLDSNDLDPTDQKDLEVLALKTGKSPEELLRELVHEALTERKRSSEAPAHDGEESLYDALSRQGLIGCIEGLPADLSSSPRHMAAFGRRG